MEEKLKEMFGSLEESHFEFIYPSESNFHFLWILDELLKLTKLINTEKELEIFETHFWLISQKIKKFFDVKTKPAYSSKADDVNAQLILLRNDLSKLTQQAGLKDFFQKGCETFLEECLTRKQESKDSDARWGQACRMGEASGLSPWLYLE